MSAVVATESNSIIVYVRDALGDKFCWSASKIEYETAAVKHARWWINYMRNPNHHVDSCGGRLPMHRCPIYPCTVVRGYYYEEPYKPTRVRRRR
jgi:hypothetical protein